MGAKTTKMPEDVRLVHAEIEGWRKRRQSRCRVPESIWLSATILARRYSVYYISRTLRLNHSRLKQRAEQRSGDSSGAPQEKNELQGHFVELIPGGTEKGAFSASFQSPARSDFLGTAHASIAVTTRSGAQLTVHVSDVRQVHLSSLLTSFLGGV